MSIRFLENVGREDARSSFMCGDCHEQSSSREDLTYK